MIIVVGIVVMIMVIIITPFNEVCTRSFLNIFYYNLITNFIKCENKLKLREVKTWSIAFEC